MKLKDLKVGRKFLFACDTILTGIYVNKGSLNNEYCLVGLSDKDNVFIAPFDTEVTLF